MKWRAEVEAKAFEAGTFTNGFLDMESFTPRNAKITRAVTVDDALRIAREAFEAGKRAAFETAIKIVEVRKAVQEGAALGAGDRRDWDTANYAEACADEATTIIAMLRNRMQPDESLTKESGE